MDPGQSPHGWRHVAEGVALIFSAGLALAVIGEITLGPSSITVHTGFVLILLGTIIGTNAMLWALMRRRIKAIDNVFEEGVQAGYARGYREGRREGRPVVVPIRCPNCGEELGRRTG